MRRTHSGQLLCVCVWENEFLPFRSQDRQDQKGAQISKSGIMWSTSLAGLRAKSEQKYCVHDQPSTSAGADSQNYTQDTECALPQACCVMETLLPYLGWWNHTFCVSVLDCAMRGLGEVISKIVCTLRIVEELLFLVSSFPPPFFPPDVCSGVGVLSQLWLLRTEAHMQRKGLATPNHHQLPSLPASFFPPPTQYWTNILGVNRDGQLWMIVLLSPTLGSYSNQPDS